ncbi:molybdopterin molybdotransferase MoeA [Halorarius litoreus]|uniref:molybdopterin molybdotransferase MoeA n=1 Tax=Halorarius litoreus TaxID=2962676 RepID=UPI0020CF4B65|nr:molybdopterin molybdotransferase MoeA [Halorarius litoreus]
MAHDHEDMVWRRDAVEQVLDARERALATRPTESVSLDQIAGRTLASPVVAQADIPNYDHATMDGYAFDATDDYPLTVTDVEIYPEDEPPSIEPGQAVEIATGAPLPPEANAVLKREESEVEDDQLRGTTLEPGTYTYEKGSNVREGEQLFAAGERLSPIDAILLGDLGREQVDVTERLSVGVLATGTEIHERRQSDLDSPMLMGLVRSWGHDATYEGTVPDESDRVTDAIADLAAEYDVVVTTGGTSVGHKDYVIRSLADLGTVEFHRVRVRPGKPIALATLPDAVAFAIPGKPLGAHTISTLVMRPFFTGETALPAVEATVSTDLAMGPDGFEYAVPVTLTDGVARPFGHTDSPIDVYEDTFDPSVLSSSTRATRADGFVLTETDLAEGDPVDVIPYASVER